MFRNDNHKALVSMSIVTLTLTSAVSIMPVYADVKPDIASATSVNKINGIENKAASSENQSSVSTTPTYKRDLVGSTLGDGLPSYSNNATVKYALSNLGITQQTVNDDTHRFNNDSMQMTYRVGLNSNYNYSQLKVVPEEDLVKDAPLRVLAAAYVSGDTVTSLPFVRNADGTTSINLSNISEIGPNAYVIYAIQPLNSSDNGTHMFLHSSSTSDFEIYGSDKSNGEQYVNGSQYVAQHPEWGTLWGVFNNQTRINVKSHAEIARGTNQSLQDFVNDYDSNSGGTFDVIDSDGKVISTTKNNFTFTNDGTYYVKYYKKLSNGDYIWNTTVVTVAPHKGADVVANYVDETGKEIADSETVSGNIGDTYETQQKKIDGYTFKNVEGNPTGQLTDKAQMVTYVYTKNPDKAADVTVNYVDETGKEIADSETVSGNIGDAYETQQKKIDGYTFKNVEGNATGQLTDKAQTVTYIYTKNPDKDPDVTTNPTHKPDASTHKPNASTHKPDTSTHEPDNATHKPNAGMNDSKPVDLNQPDNTGQTIAGSNSIDSNNNSLVPNTGQNNKLNQHNDSNMTPLKNTENATISNNQHLINKLPAKDNMYLPNTAAKRKASYGLIGIITLVIGILVYLKRRR